MANLTGTYDANAEAQKDLGKLPTGDYVAQIIDSDMKPTGDKRGHYLELTYEVIEGPLKGRKHWERLNLDNPNDKTVEIANRQFASVREATGVANPRDSQELHYKPHVIRIEFQPEGSVITYGSKKGQKRDRDEASIKAWRKWDGKALGAGNFSGFDRTEEVPGFDDTPKPASGGAPWNRRNAA